MLAQISPMGRGGRGASVTGLALLTALLVLAIGRDAIWPADPVVRRLPLPPSPQASGLDAPAGHLIVAIVGPRLPDEVRIYNLRHGTLVQRIAVAPVPLALAVDERTGRVFVAQGDTTLSILDGWQGRVLRTVAVGLLPLAVAVDARTHRVFVAGRAPLLAADFAEMIATSYGRPTGYVSTLDSRSGTLEGTVAVGQEPIALAVDAQRSRVFVANSGSATVSVLDARRGTLLRTVVVGPAPAAVVVDERRGRVFVATVRGVAVLDARTGAWVRLLRTDTTFRALAVEGRSGHLLGITARDDRVQIIDAGRGTLQQTIHVGLRPQTIALDQRDGWVILTQRGGRTRAVPPWWEQGTRWLSRRLTWLPGRLLAAPGSALPDRVSIIDLAPR